MNIDTQISHQDVDEPVFDPKIHLDLEVLNFFKISSIKKRKQINGKEDAVICAQMPDFVKIFPDYSTAKTAPGGEICKFTNAT